MDFTVSLALVDYIPVICFALGAVILMRDLYNKMSKGAYALFCAGVIDVVVAGAFKATWKLLAASNVCDFSPLNAMFFPVQSIGFMLAGVGAVAMLCFKQSERNLNSIALPLVLLAGAGALPAEYKGTFVFVGLMVAGLACLDIALCVLAKELGKPALIAVFAVSFVCCLGMGYLSSRDFAETSMNWIAEGVNVAGQGAFLLGTCLLHKAGLEILVLESK